MIKNNKPLFIIAYILLKFKFKKRKYHYLFNYLLFTIQLFIIYLLFII